MKAIKGKIIWITWSQLRTRREGWIVDGYGCINGNEWEFIQNQNFPKLAKNHIIELLVKLPRVGKWTHQQVKQIIILNIQGLVCSTFQIKKQRPIMTCVFECFQSHCHILKECHDFLHMMGFLKHLGSFIFSFVGYGLVT